MIFWRRQLKTPALKRILYQNGDEFCKNTTLHGLKYLVSGTLYAGERIFFAVFVLTGMLFTGYFIFNIFNKWKTRPVVFVTDIEPSFIIDEPFPAVTICSSNQALKSRVANFSHNSMEYAMLQFLCKSDLNETIETTSKDWNSLEQFIVNISQPCAQMLVDCHFGSDSFDCHELFHPILTDEGLCCVFNMVQPKFMYREHIPWILRNLRTTSYVPIDWYAEVGYPDDLPCQYFPRSVPGVGMSLGLSVLLNLDHKNNFCTSSNSIGFKLALHSPNESPNVRETGLLVSPGMETSLRIRPEKIETEESLRKINKYYRHCLFHNEGKLKYFRHHTQRNCEMECVADMILQYCGCISYYMPKLDVNAPICGSADAQCVEIVALGKGPSVKYCLDDCLPSCNDLTFLAEAFVAPLPRSHFGQQNNVNNVSEQDFSRNYALVHMYFKEYQFRSTIQAELIGMAEFFSNVGGILGLFLGFSFISIAEFLYFATIRPFRLINQEEQQKQQQQQENFKRFKSTRKRQKLNNVKLSPIATTFRRTIRRHYAISPATARKINDIEQQQQQQQHQQQQQMAGTDISNRTKLNEEILQKIAASLNEKY